MFTHNSYVYTASIFNLKKTYPLPGAQYIDQSLKPATTKNRTNMYFSVLCINRYVIALHVPGRYAALNIVYKLSNDCDSVSSYSSPKQQVVASHTWNSFLYIYITS